MFFFPLFDDNPSRRTPYISWLIMALCVLVFVWQQSLGPQGEQYAFYSYGFVPAHVSGAAPLPAQLVVLPAWATAISSMFLHGGLMHIGGNMLYLWIFGDNIEDSMGPLKFIIFYILCCMAAAAAQFAIDPASRIPMVGASGGIAGILGLILSCIQRRQSGRYWSFWSSSGLSICPHGLYLASGLAASLSLYQTRWPMMVAVLPISHILVALLPA